MALKYEGLFEKGDIIKGFDVEPLEGRKDRYVVGIVRDAGMVHTKTNGDYLAYSIWCVYDSGAADDNDTEHTRAGGIVHIPMGTTFDYEGRVVLVKKGPFRFIPA